MADADRIGQRARLVDPERARSGEWATAISTERAGDSHGWMVEFPDGRLDIWWNGDSIEWEAPAADPVE